MNSFAYYFAKAHLKDVDVVCCLPKAKAFLFFVILKIETNELIVLKTLMLLKDLKKLST
jgi:hypothetical protein